MSKTLVKVAYKGDMKMFPLEGKDFDKFLNHIRTSFGINENITLTVLNSPKPEPLASIEQVIELARKGTSKFQANEALSLPSLSNGAKKVEEEKKDSTKSTSITQKEASSQFFKLNPTILSQMFKKLLTSDASVVAIMDFIKDHKKTMFNGKYELKDYSEALKGMENSMAEALENNIFLMDIEALSFEDKDSKKESESEGGGEKKRSAFEGMEIEKSICGQLMDSVQKGILIQLFII
eukprot:TRINITY_DN89529_c0_g1_i1.p1 TRINITY_DN89529_c0_g1~~TRINITY_DN89529_c0_g1_i1.p1  ORF type:complete len:263 (+),score=29.97 TRINITY_DN89529_c0_g1_i1:80-790(+)